MPGLKRSYRGTTTSRAKRTMIRKSGRLRRPRRLNARTGGFLGIELKFYDTSLISSALTGPTDASGGEKNPSATISLNTVVQGDGESQRDGRQITMKSIHLKGIIDVPVQANQTVTDTASDVFIALVQDKQTNGALLNSEDVFTNPGADARTATSPFKNLQFQRRFRILAVKKLRLPQPTVVWDGTNVEQGGYQIPWEIYKSFSIGVNYSATTETIANITDNGLNVIAYTSNSTAAPTLSYNSRLRFVG